MQIRNLSQKKLIRECAFGRSSFKIPAWKQVAGENVYAGNNKNPNKVVCESCPAGETRCRGGSLPVGQSPQSPVCSPFISPCAGQTWVIAVWSVSGPDRESYHWHGAAPSSALLPSCLPTVVTTNKGGGASNHPQPWLNSRVFGAGVSSARAVNYSPVIDSTQNAKCPP